jgi:hypothetical protein
MRKRCDQTREGENFGFAERVLKQANWHLLHGGEDKDGGGVAFVIERKLPSMIL